MMTKKTLFQEFLDKLDDIKKRYADDHVPIDEIDSLINHVLATEEWLSFYHGDVFKALERIDPGGGFDVVVPDYFDWDDKRTFDKNLAMDILSVKFRPKVSEAKGFRTKAAYHKYGNGQDEKPLQSNSPWTEVPKRKTRIVIV